MNKLGLKGRKPKVTILLCGPGGVRGKFTLTILEELERRLKGKHLSECFNIVSGVSTGAIPMAMLVTPDDIDPYKPGVNMSWLNGVYNRYAKRIFPKIHFKTPKYATAKGGLYDSRNLRDCLNERLDGIKFKHALTNIVIPVFNTNAKPKHPKDLLPKEIEYISNFDPEWKEMPLTAAVVSGCSAQSYFKAQKVVIQRNGEPVELSLMDAGLVIADTVHELMEQAKSVTTPENITFVYVGTTMLDYKLSAEEYNKIPNYKLLKGGTHSIVSDLVLDANLRTALYRTRDELNTNGGNFYIIDLGLSRERADEVACELDNASDKALNTLEMLAKEAIMKNSKEIDRLVAELSRHTVPALRKDPANDNFSAKVKNFFKRNLGM